MIERWAQRAVQRRAARRLGPSSDAYRVYQWVSRVLTVLAIALGVLVGIEVGWWLR